MSALHDYCTFQEEKKDEKRINEFTIWVHTSGRSVINPEPLMALFLSSCSSCNADPVRALDQSQTIISLGGREYRSDVEAYTVIVGVIAPGPLMALASQQLLVMQCMPGAQGFKTLSFAAKRKEERRVKLMKGCHKHMFCWSRSRHRSACGCKALRRAHV